MNMESSRLSGAPGGATQPPPAQDFIKDTDTKPSKTLVRSVQSLWAHRTGGYVETIALKPAKAANHTLQTFPLL